MNWPKVKLGEVCILEKGSTGIKKAIPGPYPMVVTGEERLSHKNFQFDGEAVIIPIVSSTGHGHASIKRIHFQKGKFALGSILCAVIPKDKSKLSAEFLYYFLNLNKEEELVSRMKGMANVTLPIREIAQIEIPLPPLSYQKKIVDTLNRIHEIRDFQKVQLHNVERLAAAYLRDAFLGK